MIKKLNVSWARYLDVVVPNDAGEAQVTETKRAFYAGASAMLGKVLACADGSEEEGAVIIEGLRQEIIQFASAPH